jgi:DNA-binding FrmR family transcriptional regulator
VTHVIHNQSKLLSRVRKISGQSAALEKMLVADTGCMDVLQQIAAIRGAVNGLMAEVLEHHIVEHLGSASESAAEREADVQVVLKALRSYLK